MQLHRPFIILFPVLASCGGSSSTAPSTPPPVQQNAPVVTSFAADAATVDAGQEGVLRWDVAGASTLTISPGIGTVAASGSIKVAPDVTTAYTLTATDAQGRAAHVALTLNVNAAAAPVTHNAVLFVTQVPFTSDQAQRLSAFANHLPNAPRGGDLVLRYPDGALRFLTREAGYAHVAVREPSVSWDGKRAVFSMLDGAHWQIYEASGLGQGEQVAITRVASQPAEYNNASPLYASDGRILFTSDRPRTGEAHLYPQLDEYEATPTTTGIWSLDPATGSLRLLNHTASGAFSPTIDSYGRVVFTRWDHLQQDQLAQRDRDAVGNGVQLPFNSFNYASEAAGAAALNSREEIFPESRGGSTGPYGTVGPFTSNFFTPWSMNEDGSGEETLNHVGLHELFFGFLSMSFLDDPALSSQTIDSLHANQFALPREGGLFHLREDPRKPGTYYATVSRESATYTTDRIVKLAGSPALNGEQMTVTEVTAAGHGRYRNPLPLSDGSLLASYTPLNGLFDEGDSLGGLRLRVLDFDAASGRYVAGAPLTNGIHVDGVAEELWELEAVEVRARTRATRAQASLEAPERAVLAEEGVSEDELRSWLASRDLALIVTRDQTSRDRAELQQPYNLQVPGGVKTVSKAKPNAKVYDIAHFQLLEAEQLRAYPDRAGRRVLARPIAGSSNPANPGGPAGSVKIAPDGSTAAFVPARRAMTWQSTDPAGVPVVRERNWVSFQAGEMRVCASCHGLNVQNQAGLGTPMNKPEALRSLLKYWKTIK